MKRLFYLCVIFTSAFITSCKTVQKQAAATNDGLLEVVFVQVNDVYEIAPLAGGKEGGMARVATLKKQWLQTNPNTFLVMSGDFLSPSVFNSLVYEGKPIRGRQMVDAMNAAGTNLAVFGNHEFDIKEGELQQRLNESNFEWVATNTFHKQGNTVVPFAKATGAPFPKWIIKTVSDTDGTMARIAFIGLTLPSNPASYVSYTNALAEAKEAYNILKDSADAIVAITHQALAEDIQLAREVPGLALIMGGHEHDEKLEKEGNVVIAKAHSNARSAYIIKLKINKANRTAEAVPQLQFINETIAFDSTTNAVVQKWVNIAQTAFSKAGFAASQVVLATGEPLEGREIETRHRPTNLTRLIVSAMEKGAPQAQVAVFNSGSIRVDDVLQQPVTQYDLIRTLPFGGGIKEAEMKGRLLKKILTVGNNNKGNGGFLQFSETLRFNETTAQWLWKEAPIEDEKVYRVALTDFLLTGNETGLSFLTETNPDIIKVYQPETSGPLSDIRLAIVSYLAK